MSAEESGADLDPGAILRTLEDHGVEYVVIGGLAAILQGVPIERTQDLDIAPRRSKSNLGRLAAALGDIEARLRAPGTEERFQVPLDGRTFSRVTTMTFVTRHGPFDVSLEPDGTGGYEDLIQRAVTVGEFTISIRVAAVEDLIRSKEAAGREKDAPHLVALREFLGKRE